MLECTQLQKRFAITETESSCSEEGTLARLHHGILRLKYCICHSKMQAINSGDRRWRDKDALQQQQQKHAPLQ